MSKSLLLACMFCLLLSSIAYSDSEILIERKNEFQGETLERVFDYTSSRKHIHKIRYYYNQSRRLVMREVFLTQFMAANKGFYKMRIFWDKNQNRVKKELYYLNFLEQESGFYKKVIQYNSRGKIFKEDIMDKYGTIIPN